MKRKPTKLRIARQILGLTQLDVIRQLRDYDIFTSEATLSLWERDYKTPPSETREALARVLGVHVKSIFKKGGNYKGDE